MKIIGGPASQALSSQVARELNLEPTITDFSRFPDGELYTRILDEDVDEVTIIQSTMTDSDFVALLQLIDACEDSPVINVVIPYMGYARQDKKFKTGEPISARAIARTINADRVFTVNVHEASILDYFNADAFDLDAAYLIGHHLRSLDLQNPLLVSPDLGALDFVERTATEIGFDYDYLEKTRLSGDTVTIKTKNVDVKGRDIVLLDDMIATGGTMVESIKLLKSQGAKDVYLACVHPVLARNAVMRLYNSGVKEIISTDTIERIQSSVSVAPLIANAIKGL
ncbi:ribose-phosphate diphosphokinase [Methanolobus zinderi]|uniref:Ribose-phosphate pyrophosphokinase n=1 Tax=Methanolobus zinderi TaxID=536044 RepID=A0A7D5E5B9_9EURY|nr:ribose-phosphate diphosphokinase [Methanolobus zinderi]KXS44033.1 MAG: ribose-phosphate pyrophosphokinase [Methanolobus sp. T82-4]QLC48873.1 ribose-phosphate diphosphokinase [Methanolobus zinderi]